jgi:hypothetical protein
MSLKIFQIASKARLFKIVYAQGISGVVLDDIIFELKQLAGLAENNTSHDIVLIN